jgi:hypothetical protein
MTTGTKKPDLRIVRSDSEWLYRLLEDVRRDLAVVPTHGAVQRMRARLVREIGTPVRAAA